MKKILRKHWLLKLSMVILLACLWWYLHKASTVQRPWADYPKRTFLADYSTAKGTHKRTKLRYSLPRLRFLTPSKRRKQPTRTQQRKRSTVSLKRPQKQKRTTKSLAQAKHPKQWVGQTLTALAPGNTIQRFRIVSPSEQAAQSQLVFHLVDAIATLSLAQGSYLVGHGVVQDSRLVIHWKYAQHPGKPPQPVHLYCYDEDGSPGIRLYATEQQAEAPQQSLAQDILGYLPEALQQPIARLSADTSHKAQLHIPKGRMAYVTLTPQHETSTHTTP